MRTPFWLQCAGVLFLIILKAPYKFISSAREEYFKVPKEQALGEKIRLWLRWALEVLKSILTFPYVYVSWVRKTYSQVLRERALVDRERALVELNKLEEIGAITEAEYDKDKRDLYGLPAKNIALHQQILARICSHV